MRHLNALRSPGLKLTRTVPCSFSATPLPHENALPHIACLDMYWIGKPGERCWRQGWSGSSFGSSHSLPRLQVLSPCLWARTFVRDAKHVHEREQALRLLRSVITLPAPPTSPSRPPSSRAHRSRNGRSRSRTSQSRNTSALDQINAFTIILEQKVALTDGILRSLVSVAENPDDALRTICMQTLVEIGKWSLHRWSRDVR